LFRPLASQGAPIYVDALLRLFAEIQQRSQPLSRELALATVAEALYAPNALDLTSDAADDESGADHSLRAAAILRYFDQTGWLRTEMQSDFTQTFILPDYAFRLLGVLGDLARNEPLALRGLICSIHDLLAAAARGDAPYDRLPEAYRQTNFLLNGLKELQHNIGAHIDQVLQTLEARDVLEQFFTQYRGDIMDRAYHQLRTTDHLSRYRPTIINALSAIERTDTLEQSARHLHSIGEAASIDQAVIQLAEQIRTIRDQFAGLDRLLELIDTRHSQFVDSAVRTIELHLTANATTSGQLHTILTQLLAVESGRADDPLPDQYAPLINLFELGLVDEASLAVPTRAATPFEPEQEPPELLSPAEIEQAHAETLAQMNRAISRERVRRYAIELLDGHNERRGGEIPLTGADDLPLLIYLRSYGDGSLGYTLEQADDAAWIERNGVGFRDFVLKKTAVG
jgi:DNA-binding transcriptional ArsR family regulator